MFNKNDREAVIAFQKELGDLPWCSSVGLMIGPKIVVYTNFAMSSKLTDSLPQEYRGYPVIYRFLKADPADEIE